MPSLASGYRSWTAWAMTCAVECRRTFSPSGDSIETDSTIGTGRQRLVQVAQFTVHPHDHDAAVIADEVLSGGIVGHGSFVAVVGDPHGHHRRGAGHGDGAAIVAAPSKDRSG